MLVAPEVLLDRRANTLGGVSVALRERRLVSRRHRRGRNESAIGRGGAVRVLPVGLLPEVDAGKRQARLLVHEAAEEVGRCTRGRPELAIECCVAELAPRGLVGEHGHPGLVELMKTPARRERAVRPVALEPESLRRLLAREPAERRHREVAATRCEEAENDVAEIARPDEAVPARLLERGVELRSCNGRARLTIGQLLEDEERARVEITDGRARPLPTPRGRPSRGRTPSARRRARSKPTARRPTQPRDRLVRGRAERDEHERFSDEGSRDEPVDGRAMHDDVVGRVLSVRLAQRGSSCPPLRAPPRARRRGGRRRARRCPDRRTRRRCARRRRDSERCARRGARRSRSGCRGPEPARQA